MREDPAVVHPLDVRPVEAGMGTVKTSTPPGVSTHTEIRSGSQPLDAANVVCIVAHVSRVDLAVRSANPNSGSDQPSEADASTKARELAACGLMLYQVLVSRSRKLNIRRSLPRRR